MPGRRRRPMTVPDFFMVAPAGPRVFPPAVYHDQQGAGSKFQQLVGHPRQPRRIARASDARQKKGSGGIYRDARCRTIRPVTSPIAAEIRYDLAGEDRSRALHPAGRRTPSRRRPPLGTPHQLHRPNAATTPSPIGSGPPPSPPSASISDSQAHTTDARLQWHTYDH